MKIVWTGGHEPAQNPLNKKEKHTLAVVPVMNCGNLLRVLPAVPPGGADGDDRGDLPAHQLCLLQPLVLHCPGNLGDAHPPLSLPAPPQTLQGGSGGTCADSHGHADCFADRRPSRLRCR